MPPHLHPRSRMTSSLFATAVAASFFVVGLPHLLPCPVPATKFADGEAGAVVVDENGRRWKRKRSHPETPGSQHGVVQFSQAADDEDGADRLRAASRRSSQRACPVPKPGGLIGEWLGFHTEEHPNAGRRREGMTSDTPGAPRD